MAGDEGERAPVLNLLVIFQDNVFVNIERHSSDSDSDSDSDSE